MGADGIGWKNRKLLPGQVRKGDWLVGYGMAAGTFGAHRSGAKVRATLLASGALVLQSAVTDIGPGTGTAMTQIAADTIGIAPGRITFQLGNSQFPQAGNQGGSSTVASVGSAVVAACQALQQRLLVLAAGNHPAFTSLTVKEVVFEDGAIATKDKATQLLYTDLLKKNNMQDIDVIEEAKPGNERQQYSMYSYSVHFAEVHVHAVTGQVKVAKVVSCADAGIIVNSKTAGNQIIGGVTGGIGMALHEHAVMDHRYGRYMAKDFADYHVPVHADIPKVDVHFVNKPDYLLNPMGTKGLGEIAIIGVAPAITNAIFNATGKRIRELPVTPDKLL